MAATLGLRNWSHRLGVVWRRHNGNCSIESEANRCLGADRKPAIGSDDSRRLTGIEDRNAAYLRAVSHEGFLGGRVDHEQAAQPEALESRTVFVWGWVL